MLTMSCWLCLNLNAPITLGREQYQGSDAPLNCPMANRNISFRFWMLGGFPTSSLMEDFSVNTDVSYLAYLDASMHCSPVSTLELSNILPSCFLLISRNPKIPNWMTFQFQSVLVLNILHLHLFYN